MAGKAVRSRRRQTARRVFLWSTVFFLSIQLISGLLLDYRYPWVRFPSAGRVLAVPRLSGQNPDIVFLGSSRFGAGVDLEEVLDILHRNCPPGCAAAVFNAAVEAGDLVAADFMLKELLADGVRPAVAVVEVSPETLNRRNDWMVLHVHRQLRWHDAPAYLPDIARSGNAVRWLRQRLVPLYIHREQIRFRLGVVINGWLGDAGLNAVPEGVDITIDEGLKESKPVPWDQMLGGEEEQARVAPLEKSRQGGHMLKRMLRKYHPGGTAAAALERLIRRCRAHNIDVILVGVPVTATHRSFYTPDIESAFRDYVGRVVRTYRCRFIDYRDRVPDPLFMDIHHLTPEGAVYFSNLLTRDVLLPAWRECLARRNLTPWPPSLPGKGKVGAGFPRPDPQGGETPPLPEAGRRNASGGWGNQVEVSKEQAEDRQHQQRANEQPDAVTGRPRQD